MRTLVFNSAMHYSVIAETSCRPVNGLPLAYAAPDNNDWYIERVLVGFQFNNSMLNNTQGRK